MRKHHITALTALLLILAIALAGCDDNADADIERSRAMSIALYDNSIHQEDYIDGAVIPLYRADWDIDTGEVSYDGTSMMIIEGDFYSGSIHYWDGDSRFLINENALRLLESDSDIKFDSDERDPTLYYGEGITMHLEDDIAELTFDDGKKLSFSIQPEEAPESLDGTNVSINGLGATDEAVTIIYRVQKVDGSVSLFCVKYDRGDGSVTWSEAIELNGQDTSDLMVHAWFNLCYFDGVRLYSSGINIWCYDTSTNEVYELEAITQSIENLVSGYTRGTLIGEPLVSNVLGGMEGTVICGTTLVNTGTGEVIGVSYAIAEASLTGALGYNGETITSYDANLEALAETVIDLPLGSVGMRYPKPYYYSEG